MLIRTELVGREPEMAALATFLADARSGRPRVVLCEGEPGIGKTRLAEEVVAHACANGALGAWGAGLEVSGAPPYRPWAQVVRAVANKVDLAAIGARHGLTPELARLVPDVFGAGPNVDADASLEDRFRQFDAVARLLRHVSLQAPLVIVLDDAHSADEPSLLLLQHVARSLTDERLLLVVNARDTERRHRPVLEALTREPLTRRIHLVGLTTGAIRRQLALLTGDDPDESEVGEVEAVTGGNPLFVAEMGRVLADRRAGRRPPLATPTVRDAIGRRLDRLSPACVRLLRAAAVVGREFPVDLVATMADVPVVDALGLLDEARDAGLVEAADGSAERRFVHALVQDAIEAELGTPEQLRLHRAAAEAIEREHPAPRGSVLFELARHWAAAAMTGERARAAGWLERAGAEAMRQRAYEDAARLFRQALTVGGNALADETRCRLLLGTGEAANLAGDFGACLDACLDAADVGRSVGRPDLVAEAALRLNATGEPGVNVVIRRLCEEATGSLPADAGALRARLMAKFAETFIFLAEADAAGPASEAALSLAEQSLDPTALAAALRARQVVCAGPDGLDERERLADRLLELSRSTADPRMEMSAHSWQIDAALERGDLARVATEIDALSACADQVRGPMARFEVLSCRAVLALARGRFADALRLEHEAFTVLVPTRHPAAFHVRAGLVAQVGRQVGHDARSLAAATFADAPDEVRDSAGLIAAMNRALASATAGRRDEAAELYRALGPVDAWRPPPHVVLLTYAFGIVVAVALDVPADVSMLHDLLVPYRSHHAVSGTTAVTYFGPVELWLGVAAQHLGSLDAAVADLEAAERACAANGAAGYRAEAQYELASVLARRSGRGDVERARSLLEQARVAAAQLGMTPVAGRVARLAARLDVTAERVPLTRRELEVAGLVAQGLTNREIATRLFTSERTAANHVQHILTKLGMSNRSQIATWASARKMSTASE